MNVEQETGSDSRACIKMLGWVKRMPALMVMLAVFVVVFSLLLVRYSDRFNRNITGFLLFGDKAAPAEMIPANAFCLPNSVGYDGQFYYFMVQDPFITGDMHKYVDVPANRYQRIVYAWLAAMLAPGRPSAIPLTLLLVNVAAMVMGTGFVGLTLKKQGLSPWYALFYGFLCGLFMTTVRSVAEPVAMGFLVGCLYFYSERRFLLSAIFVTLAVLSRETLVAVVPVLVFDSVILRRNLKGGFMAILTLIPIAMWQLYIFARLDVAPWRIRENNLSIPFVGMIRHAQETFRQAQILPSEKMYMVAFLLVTVVTLAYAVREIVRARDEISICFFGYSVMPLFVNSGGWKEPWCYSRAQLASAVFLIMAFARSRDKAYLVPLAIHAALFVIFLVWQDVLFRPG